MEGDIRRYLEHRLGEIAIEMCLKEGHQWPGAEKLDALVKECGKLFVYASTALRYIADRRGRVKGPEHRLNNLLRLSGRDEPAKYKDNPYKELDQLYLEVLVQALPEGDSERDEFAQCLRSIIGSIVKLRDPLSVEALSAFLAMDSDEVFKPLDDLHSILLVPPNDEPQAIIGFLHPSFPDFIEYRCSDMRFKIDAAGSDRLLLLGCLRIMGKLHEDMLELGDPWVESDETEDLDDRFSPQLRYACLYWASHLKELKSADAEMLQELATFSEKHMLHWLESLTWLRSLAIAVKSMEDAHNWASEVSRSTLS